jgi:D-sedoheptulose 7-phosphate isomerase
LCRNVLIAISASCRSPNILRAIAAARQQGLNVVGLTGKARAEVASICDLCLCAPADATQLIQQIHISAAHKIYGLVEERALALTAEENDPRTPALRNYGVWPVLKLTWLVAIMLSPPIG